MCCCLATRTRCTVDSSVISRVESPVARKKKGGDQRGIRDQSKSRKWLKEDQRTEKRGVMEGRIDVISERYNRDSNAVPISGSSHFESRYCISSKTEKLLFSCYSCASGFPSSFFLGRRIFIRIFYTFTAEAGNDEEQLISVQI